MNASILSPTRPKICEIRAKIARRYAAWWRLLISLPRLAKNFLTILFYFVAELVVLALFEVFNGCPFAVVRLEGDAEAELPIGGDERFSGVDTGRSEERRVG